MLRKWEPITPLSRERNKGDATASERYAFPMRTSAPTQPFQTEPTSNSNSEIRNQQMPCSAAAADESAAMHLFNLSRDVILSLDRIGKILCINHRGVELSGYSESELRGANIFELLLVPEDREFAREMLADLLKGETREYQVRWRTKDDGIVHFDGASVPRLSESGEFLSTLCTLRDVTERKSAEERLRKSEEKYRDLIEISPDAIYVVDADGICLLGNRAGAELAGIPQDQLVGTPVTDTYLPEERHLFREKLEKIRMEGCTISRESCRRTAKSSRWKSPSPRYAADISKRFCAISPSANKVKLCSRERNNSWRWSRPESRSRRS